MHVYKKPVKINACTAVQVTRWICISVLLFDKYISFTGNLLNVTCVRAAR